MMEVLRNRAIEALASASAATLSTNGPGGIQAGLFPCEANGLALYLLVPSTSDVLFNLEAETAVVVTSQEWQVEGEAEVMPFFSAPDRLGLTSLPEASGCVLVMISVYRIHLKWTEGWGYRETIDI